MSQKPQFIAEFHRDICQAAKCPHVDNLNFADNCAFCPAGHWGKYECAEGTIDRPVAYQLQDLPAINPQPWPLALIPLKILAKTADRGLGDIVERIVGPIGGTAFKAWYLKIFGKSCGCTQRRDDWNRLYPL